MEKLKVLTDETTVVIDEEMEEAYATVNVFSGVARVGTFAMCSTTHLEEALFIEHLNGLDAAKLMVRPELFGEPKLIQALHNHLMASENMCLYGDDMEEWFADEMNMNFDDIIEELKLYVEQHPRLKEVLTFDDEYHFIVWGDFAAMFNLIDLRPHCPHCGNLVEELHVVSGEASRFIWNPRTKKFEQDEFLEVETKQYCPSCENEIYMTRQQEAGDQMIELEWE